MAIPSGYTALDFVGFTDKGTYANNITYVKNDLAHYGGDIWKCLVDNTIGVTPSEGVNWTLWIGAPTNLVERIIAPLETNPATVAYAVGRQIIYDDWLWEVIAPIAVGDSLIDYAVDPTNANIKKSPSVETQVLAIKNGLGTAAAKDFTTSVTSGSADLVTSGAVYSEVDALSTALTTYEKTCNNHNIPRLVPKDISSYISDGTFYKRLNGTDGFTLFEDIYVGDYIKMSRAITAPNQDSQYAVTGSQYVTIIGLDTLMKNNGVSYHHAVMTAGQGFGGTQHFGRKRMYASTPFTLGYVGSEMNTDTLGSVASSGSTASGATINQQLYAEFGSHLKTTSELLSTANNSTGVGRFGTASGCVTNWAWTSVQAVLMSEIEVYGSIVWGASGYDIGTAKEQFPLFAFSKEAMNNGSAYYWLKDIASGSFFCYCYYDGGANNTNATRANCDVRPRFVIGA